jgi:uncharacterized membrane protein YphA (DoxX/SURF4 family)
MVSNDRQAVTLSEAAQTTMRMLIASYFIAAATGSIPGADTGALFAFLLPAPLDHIMGSSLVFLLATMVMIGARTRPAALLLGLITFYASYVELMHIGVAHVLGQFWRDMALIAALMLTYGCDRAHARAMAGPPKGPPPVERSPFAARRKSKPGLIPADAALDRGDGQH